MSFITVDNVIDALAVYVAAAIGDNTIPIVRGNANLVSQPPSGYIILTEISSEDFETPLTSLDSDAQIMYYRYGIKTKIQMDLLGTNAGEWNAKIKLMFRTAWAVSLFPAGISPLFVESSFMRPIVQGSAQNETRWITTAVLQYNPELSFAQQSATDLAINILQGVQ